MDAKEKAYKHIKKCEANGNIRAGDAVSQAIDIAIQQAKKEVLNVIEKNNIYQEHESCIAIDKKTFKKMKQRHLST